MKKGKFTILDAPDKIDPLCQEMMIIYKRDGAISAFSFTPDDIDDLVLVALKVQGSRPIPA